VSLLPHFGHRCSPSFSDWIASARPLALRRPSLLRSLATFVAYARSPLRICGKNVILCRHPGMARETTFGASGPKLGGRKGVGRWIISPLGICPAVRIRKSPGILLDEGNRFQGVRHVYQIRGCGVLFERPLDLRNL